MFGDAGDPESQAESETGRVAFVSPWIAYALFATVSVIWFVPDRRLSRR